MVIALGESFNAGGNTYELLVVLDIQGFSFQKQNVIFWFGRMFAFDEELSLGSWRPVLKLMTSLEGR